MPRAFAVALVAVLAVCGTAAAQDSDSFAADLAAARELVRTRVWKRGRETYEKLLQEYEGDTRVVAALPGIERDLQLCLFNVGRRVPTGDDLFGPNVVKFSASSRRLEMVFEKGLADAPWEKQESGFARLPMRFADDLVVTVPADGPNSRFDKESRPWDSEFQVRVRVLFALNQEHAGGYLAILPYTFESGSVGDYVHEAEPSYPFPTDFRVFDFGASPPRLVKKEYWWTKRGSFEKGTCRWVRVTHKGDLIKLEAEGCKQMGTRDTAHDGGYVAVSTNWVRGDAGRPISIRIEGELDRTYLTKAIAQHEDAAFAAWKEKEYRREDVLPAWLLQARSTTTTSVVALPADLPDEQRDQVREFLAWMLSTETTTEMELPQPEKLPPASSALVAGALSLMRGELAAADERFTALLAADPSFHAGLLWRARARYRLRAVDGADADLAAAAEHLSGDPAYHEMLADVRLSQGDLDGARDALAAAQASGAWTARLAELATGVVAAARGPHWARTFRKQTRHFEILSDHSQDMCQQIDNVLSDAVRRFAKSFRTIPEKRLPARVYVFSSKDAYEAFAKEVGSSLAHSAGAYLPRLHILVIWMPKDRRDFAATVRHEGFHQYAHLFLDDLPIWFNEGYAEYFGNIPRERVALGHETDREGLARRVKANRSEFVPLPELIRMSRSEFMSKPEPRYVQAWAAVTFLADTDDGEMKGRLDRYFDALLAGQSNDQAFEAAFADVALNLSNRFTKFLDGLE